MNGSHCWCFSCVFCWHVDTIFASALVLPQIFVFKFLLLWPVHTYLLTGSTFCNKYSSLWFAVQKLVIAWAVQHILLFSFFSNISYHCTDFCLSNCFVHFGYWARVMNGNDLIHCFCSSAMSMSVPCSFSYYYVIGKWFKCIWYGACLSSMVGDVFLLKWSFDTRQPQKSHKERMVYFYNMLTCIYVTCKSLACSYWELNLFVFVIK